MNMNKVLTTLAAVTVSTATCQAAISLTKGSSDFDFSYTGSQIHAGGYLNGWSGLADNDGSFDLSNSASTLQLDTTGTSHTSIQGTNAGWSTVRTGDWTFEMQAKFNNVANGFALWLGTGTQLALVEVYNDRISEYQDTPQFATGLTLNDGASHTVRVAFDGSDSLFYVYLDDNLLNPAGQAPLSPFANGDLNLGDFASSTFGDDLDIDVENISFTDGAFAPVPEPSSTALLGLGGMALLLRRRK